MNSIIELKRVSKSYAKKNKKSIEIFKDVNYKFYPKKVYLIKGMSGSGKTTLINIIGTLLDIDSGQIIIDNQDLTKLNSEEKAIVRKEKIGFIFQDYNLHPYMRAFENVMIPLFLEKTNIDKKKKAINALEKIGLKNRVNHFPKELSGGEQQRVAIARALINNPKIVLADEPTGALDPENEEKVLTLLRKIANEGKCIIIVSHSKNVEKYADNILYIKNKKIVGDSNE